MTPPAAPPGIARGAGLLTVFLLAACAGGGPPPVAVPAADTPAAGSPVEAMETARLPEPKEDPRSYPEPAALSEMAEPQLREVLGEPGFVRRDPPAEIWQYRTDGCVLHLFLYAEEGKPLALRHLEARRPEGGATETTDCVRHVIDARPRARAG